MTVRKQHEATTREAYPRKRGLCVRCHEPKFLKHRGLCETCWRQCWRTGSLENYPESVPPNKGRMRTNRPLACQCFVPKFVHGACLKCGRQP